MIKLSFFVRFLSSVILFQLIGGIKTDYQNLRDALNSALIITHVMWHVRCAQARWRSPSEVSCGAVVFGALWEKNEGDLRVSGGDSEPVSGPAAAGTHGDFFSGNESLCDVCDCFCQISVPLWRKVHSDLSALLQYPLPARTMTSNIANDVNDN